MTSTIIRTATEPKTSAHIGTIGDRVRVDGVIRAMIGNKPSIMHMIEDADGNQFVVRRSSPMGSGRGVLVSLEATVIEHRVYKDVKQTVLSAGHQMVVGDDHPMARR